MLPIIFSDKGRYPHEIRDLTIEESQAVIAVCHFLSLIVAFKVIWPARYELASHVAHFAVWLVG
jgi:hypothetical protein